jgi:hypothetical protein
VVTWRSVIGRGFNKRVPVVLVEFVRMREFLGSGRKPCKGELGGRDPFPYESWRCAGDRCSFLIGGHGIPRGSLAPRGGV